MPNLYKDTAAGVKNSTYYQRKTEKAAEPFVYDAADLLRRAHIQEKGSVLLSHVNRAKQSKFKNQHEKDEYLSQHFKEWQDSLE